MNSSISNYCLSYWFCFVFGIMVWGLTACKDQATTETNTIVTEALPPASPSQPSRPNRPVPEPKAPVSQPVIAANFTPQPNLEKIISIPLRSSIFEFRFDSPTEMAAPRQLLFSGVLETPLAAEDLPTFNLQLYNNSSDYANTAATVYNAPLPMTKEAKNAFSFQLTTPDALSPGLYYYLIKDDSGRMCYAAKVIVDY